MTSNWKTTSVVLDYLRMDLGLNGFESVLDIGMGYGKYGMLIRDLFETPFGNFTKDKFRIRIDGVESFPEALTFQYDIYNNIYGKKLQEFTPEIKYDIALYIDILEHMEKEESISEFKRLMSFAKRNIIATPKTFILQKLEVNKEFDQHKAQINPEDFGLPYKRLDTDDNCNYIYIINGGK